MAKLALIYGMMHLIEGSNEEDIRRQLLQSLDAFFDFYPEI